MRDTEFDYYADEERAIPLSEGRLRFMQSMLIVGKTSAIVGVTLIAATYLDSAFVFHQYYFFITEHAALAIVGSFALVLAGNAFPWSFSRPTSLIRVIAKVAALAVASPVATFFLVLAIYMTAGQLGHPAN